MADNWGSDPYWNYGSYTGPGGYDWGETPYGNEMYENNTNAAYMRYLSGLGMGGTESAYDRWLRDQYARVMTGYTNATISDPNMRIMPYLNSLGTNQDWYSRYMQQTTPSARGESWSNYAGPVRWVGR